jgi:hypothetical protein
MKHLKGFKIFEAVIKAYDFTEAFEELKSIKNITLEDLERIFKPLDVEFVDVDYFKSKLQTKKEIELVPVNMPHIKPGLRFAAHNIYTNKMYVCIEADSFLKTLNSPSVYTSRTEILDLLEEILRHESIHKQQGEKRPNVTLRNLENSPLKPKEYFSSTDEIMAYADSFITQCRKRGMSNEKIKDILVSGKTVSWIQGVYSKFTTPQSQKRFKKYVYQYLEDENN